MSAPHPPGGARPTRVALVVDTGVDDALALAMAVRHPRLELAAVIATAGNVPLPRAMANTRLVLAALDAAPVVLPGSERRLDGRPFPRRAGHGHDGLAGCASRAGSTAAAVRPADPGALAAALDDVEVVVSCAPLTPLAAVLSSGITPRWPRLLVVAAASPAEPNAAMDAAAAATVLARGDGPAARVDHYPYRRFAETSGTAALPEIPATGPAAGLLDDLLAHQLARGAGLGDAGALLDLVRPAP